MLPYGIWGNGKVNSQGQFNNLLPYINGFNYRLAWTDIQTGPSTFNWNYFDTQLAYALDANLPIGYMLYTGNNAPISGTNNWLAGLIPTFTNDRGTWPYYMDDTYILYWYGFHDAVIDHIANTYSTHDKNLLYYIMSAEGSTGDEGPYKGTIPTQYEIDESAGGEWDQFKRDFWTHLNTKLLASLPNTKPMYNGGNDRGNYQWIEANVPRAWGKAGNFSHNYSFSDDKNYALDLEHFRSYPDDEGRIRGEFEGIDETAWWQQAPKKNFMPLVRQCLHGAIDMLNIAYATITQNNLDHTPMDFFDRHAGVRDVSEAIGGFIAFRDVIDITDTTRFPESGPGSYGTLISQNVSTFNNRVNQINASECNAPNYNNCLSPQNVVDAIAALYIDECQTGCTGDYKYINPARVTAIRAAFPNAQYSQVLTDSKSDSYSNDYNTFSIPGNYQKYISQYSPDTTSIGNWRVGPVNSYYGRYTRSFNLSNPSPEIFLTLDPGLDTGGDNNVSITVIYYDSGTGIFSVNCATCKGKSEAAVVQKKNTGVFVTRTFTVDKFLFGGNLANGADITLKYLSGDNTEFDSVEVINNSKL